MFFFRIYRHAFRRYLFNEYTVGLKLILESLTFPNLELIA